MLQYIIHDKKDFLPLAKQKIDALDPAYYVTRGNHDMVSADYWQEVWGMPLNHTVIAKDQAVILADTSNEAGKYLSPNLEWLQEQLEANKKRKHVLLFLHIPQKAWTSNAVNTPGFESLVDKYPNVTAIFHGHEHDQDGVKLLGNRQTPCLFDAHMGGNWGTPYKGFRVVEILKDGTLVSYMMNPDETKIIWKLRRALAGLEQQQALELVLNRLKETSSNVEFLMQVQKSMPVPTGSDGE